MVSTLDFLRQPSCTLEAHGPHSACHLFLYVNKTLLELSHLQFFHIIDKFQHGWYNQCLGSTDDLSLYRKYARPALERCLCLV